MTLDAFCKLNNIQPEMRAAMIVHLDLKFGTHEELAEQDYLHAYAEIMQQVMTQAVWPK